MAMDMDLDGSNSNVSKRLRAEDSSISWSSSNSSLLSCPFCSYQSSTQVDLDFHHHIHHQHHCSECRQIFPSYFLLDLHMDEVHNPYRRSSCYRCLIESCKETFSDLDQRLKHLSTEHSTKDRQMHELLRLFANHQISSMDSSKQKFGYDCEKTFVRHTRLKPRSLPQSSHWDPEED